ncbi:patatin-like phospholipase family protein [Nostoc sp. GT001]|uniref:patatin-like phospholipase family protein n=1 Tax=Nostoc sp. GT001 TaxID=3056647 RepID=UPI0025AACB45|nr:patatin-like phospholipase family protein [Nostoc sp. GT001]MDM9580783.1 patatin-like phospholipase family protein [Nostoc sp. GT001]
MPKKLAIVISGAVSLGSYEAGVMYEILEAIARHNESINNNEDRIEIDVIAGASAGGMTACILAQHLLCGDQTAPFNQDQSLRKPYNNPLYNTWVDEVDIRQLIDVKKDCQKYSLLQTKVVEDIGKKYLQDNPKFNEKHPASASQIYVSIAMSNLSGYTFPLSTDYDRSKKSQKEGIQEFAYTRYKDQFVCVARRDPSGSVTLDEIDRETTRNLETKQETVKWQKLRDTNWTELREVGLSSGAFPFAFRLRKIQRFGGFGKRHHRDDKYLYTDGGVFENEPIGMAKLLVDKIDENQDSSNKRYYLYIAPGQRQLPDNPFIKKDDDLLVTGVALLSSIFHQSRFQDWIMEEMNAPVFSITAHDFELIGDVFSAFAGFLEKKFRAYDYNIGRERTQYELSNPEAKSQLQDLLKRELNKMPPLEWIVNCKIAGKELDSWDDAKKELSKLAKPRSEEGKQLKDNELKKRDQLVELRRLMAEVDKETRNKILDQLTFRLESLVDLINDRLEPLDRINNGSPLFKLWSSTKLNARIYIGKPLTKLVLKGILRFWLQQNILNLKD